MAICITPCDKSTEEHCVIYDDIPLYSYERAVCGVNLAKRSPLYRYLLVEAIYTGFHIEGVFAMILAEVDYYYDNYDKKQDIPFFDLVQLLVCIVDHSSVHKDIAKAMFQLLLFANGGIPYNFAEFDVIAEDLSLRQVLLEYANKRVRCMDACEMSLFFLEKRLAKTKSWDVLAEAMKTNCRQVNDFPTLFTKKWLSLVEFDLLGPWGKINYSYECASEETRCKLETMLMPALCVFERLIEP